MKTTDNSVMKHGNQEVIVDSRSRISNMWTDFENKKGRYGTFVAFNDYRISLGGRGIWGTKTFFRAMIEIGFLEECNKEISHSVGKYCPTEHASIKYGDLFRYDSDENIWGLSQEHLEDFDRDIFPALINIARKIEIRHTEEKKEIAKARYLAKKARETAAKPIEGMKI